MTSPEITTAERLCHEHARKRVARRFMREASARRSQAEAGGRADDARAAAAEWARWARELLAGGQEANRLERELRRQLPGQSAEADVARCRVRLAEARAELRAASSQRNQDWAASAERDVAEAEERLEQARARLKLQRREE